MLLTGQPKTIPELVSVVAENYGSQPAVVQDGIVTTYTDLSKLVQRAAGALTASGLKRGERVAVWMPNRLEFIIAMLGAQYIGAAVVPINTRYRGHEAYDLLVRSNARFLFVDNGFLDADYIAMVRQAASGNSKAGGDVVAGLPDLSSIVNLGEEAAAYGCVSWSEFMARANSQAQHAAESQAAEVSPDDVCDIMFTSGTTGRPKGVMSAQRQTLSVAHVWAEGAELSTADNYAIVSPFFHTFGYKAGFVSAFIAGSTVYTVDVFDAESLLQLIQEARITVLPGAPTIFTSLMNHPRLSQFDISSLRFSIAGAATVPESLFHDMKTVLGFDKVAQSYGLTECVVATRSRPNEDPFHIAATTGPAVTGMEVRIVGSEGNDLPSETDGQILLRGDNVMLGYFEDPQATAEALDSHGWLHTGDIGRLDEHGCVKITGRLKEMFTVGGFNVYPAEVENILATHPSVEEVAVIGIADERLGSVGRAYVTLSDSNTIPTPNELIAFCRDRIANFKVPREVVTIEAFPRNATGKIMKEDLREFPS